MHTPPSADTDPQTRVLSAEEHLARIKAQAAARARARNRTKAAKKGFEEAKADEAKIESELFRVIDRPEEDLPFELQVG